MHSIFPVRLRAASSGVLPLLLLATLGCGDSQIRSYSVPKDSPRGGRPAVAPSMQAPVAEAMPVWELPAGWQEMPGSGMRFATITMGAEEDAPQIRVTPLGAMAGEPLANVNRWLDQLGQPPLAASDLGKVMRTVGLGDQMADLIHLEGEQEDGSTQQILAAILPLDERVWFFMTQGDKKDLAPHVEAFDRFVQNVRVESPEPMMPPDHPPVEGAATPDAPATMSAPPSGPPVAVSSSGGPGELSWKLPPGWVEVENSSNMRLATFEAGAGKAEITITRFPGDVGGELANVNRWRRQVSLAPVASMGDQDKSDLALASGMGTYLDLSGSSSRMLVVFASHGGFTWFLKMSGPVDVLDGETGNFKTFVNSVSLPGASG